MSILTSDRVYTAQDSIDLIAWCLQGAGAYEVSGQEALKALRLTCAAWESIQSGRPVEP